MDGVQILNGVSAGIAAVIWFEAAIPRKPILGNQWAGALSAACCAFCLWYAGANLLLGFGIIDPPLASVVPLFRFAFAPLVLLPALRYLSQRHLRQVLRAPLPIIRPEGGTEGTGDE